MSRRKHSTLTEEDEPELDISSLIDVCFLLLIYFMVTATIQPRESDIGLQLPSSAASSVPSDLEPMLVEVQDDGSVIVNNDEKMDLGASGPKRDLPLLQQRLETYKLGAEAGGAEALVQVAVRGEAPQQSVVDVLNCLVGVGIDKVTFTDFQE
ncbi:ExbD/TolR family protein [Rubritalea spongiae]|uniref:ExbD/TolR family protein n=1 Tax=Rubritalea spongiae TaxID=430797 RepID=A0ABW5E276_9BACT